MGSLPNLSEFCREKAHRRAADKELDMARARARQIEFNRTDGRDNIKDRLPTSFQTQVPKQHHHHRHSLTTRKVHRTRSSGATHHIWDDPMIEHMSAYSPISSRSHRVNTLPPYQISATANSTVSTAVAPVTAATILPSGNATSGSRRRESLNSSIGATSIRRLLAVNRGCRHKIPVHIRAKVAKNFTFLILAHGLTCAVLVPFFGLQASNSMWFHQEKWLLRRIGPNVGPLLLSFCCLVTSGMCLLTGRLVKKIGYVSLIAAHYVALCAFLIIHLYPTIWLLVPAYALLGLTLGPAWICKWNLVVFYASRISCGQHECSSTTATLNDTASSAPHATGGTMGSGSGTATGGAGDEHKMFCNRNERVRRLARFFHAVQDIGIFVGALIASIIISCAATQSGCFYTNKILKSSRDSNNNSSNNSDSSGSIRATETDIILLNTFNATANAVAAAAGIDRSSHLNKSQLFPNELSLNKAHSNVGVTDALNKLPTSTSKDESPMSSVAATAASETNGMSILKLYHDTMFLQHDELLDSLYNTNERGIRICGAGSCPTWNYSPFDGNITEEYNWFTFSGTIPMTVFYLLLALLALTLACLSQQVDNTLKYESIKGITDTLLFAGPMAYFIGTEQGYVLGGFTRAFVSCSLGAQMVAGALVGMGLMQCIVSCTLSMLLRHTKRYAVLVAAFFFHACLLLVLSNWKPSKDDSALFYVIAAAWGACNGIWETLLFALITLTHPNHVMEVASPLQACRFLGLGITFAAHGFLCENPKILILFILLVVSVIPYAMLETRLEGQRKAHSSSM